MIHSIRNTADFLIKLFALGLFVSIILNWLDVYAFRQIGRVLNRCYDVVLDPIRRYVRPIRLSSSAPVGLDLAPLILLIIVWWLVHPFLMWVLS